MAIIRIKEVFRYLGYRNGKMPDEATLKKIENCIERLQEAASPKSVYLRFPIFLSEKLIEIGSIQCNSIYLRRHLEGCGEAFLFAATLGPGPDTLIRRAQIQKISDAVILQAAGAEFIEAYCDEIQENISENLKKEGKVLKARFSPGYGDLPLSLQKELLRVLDTPKSIGVSLTDSLLMVPSKSVSAIIGVYDVCSVNHTVQQIETEYRKASEVSKANIANTANNVSKANKISKVSELSIDNGNGVENDKKVYYQRHSCGDCTMTDCAYRIHTEEAGSEKA